MKYEIDFVKGDANQTAGEVDRLAEEIAALRTQEGEALYYIGRKLVEAKARLVHGQWLAFLKDNRVGYLPRTAQILMMIARAEDGRALARYGIAKASALLKLPLAQRRKLLQEFDVNLMSVSELYALIRRILGLPPSAGRRGTTRAPGSACTVENEIAWAAGVLHLPIEGLSESAIERAFCELAQIFHPDHARTSDSKFMRNLLAARDTLKVCGQKPQAA